MNKFYFYLMSSLMALVSFTVRAQINVRPVKVSDLQKATSFAETFDTAVSWTAAGQVHYVIISSSHINSNTRYALRDAHIHAYHYLVKDSTQLLWEIQDGVYSCEVDYHAYFVKGSFAITDLNHNTVPEIWTMYSVACRGDISPSSLKVIMYEGMQKFAMRGHMTSKLACDDPGAGKYTFDANFKNADKRFQQYAMNLWEKYKEEEW